MKVERKSMLKQRPDLPFKLVLMGIAFLGGGKPGYDSMSGAASRISQKIKRKRGQMFAPVSACHWVKADVTYCH